MGSDRTMGLWGSRALPWDSARGGAAMFALLISLGIAGAQEVRAEPGTYFLIEGDGGYEIGGAFAEGPDGWARGITIGAGAKPKGWPLRFFGIASFSWADLEGAVEGSAEGAVIERDAFKWSLGLRVIAPIAERLRAIVDTTLGSILVDSTAILGRGAERIASRDEGFFVGVRIGLQWRLHYRASVGARFDLTLPTGLSGFDPLAEAAGARSGDAGSANAAFGLTATFHL